MKYTVSPQLRQWLLKDKRMSFGIRRTVWLNDTEYRKHFEELSKGSRPLSEIPDAAAFRVLTSRYRIAWTTRMVVAAVVVLLILGLSQLARGQNANTTLVVSACAGSSLTVGTRAYLTVLPDGTLCVGTVVVSGTVTATQGTSPWVIGDGSGALNVIVDSSATLPVTGTFFQATQPVSLATAPSTPVTGTFWQSTQPVSIASMPSTPVTGTFWQSTQPVSGTFFQSTQPVSIATMPSTPVTGTFWQATQPVSGTFWQATQPVSGTFWQATQPVSGTLGLSTATTATLANVSASLSNVTLLASNANRKGAMVFNDSATASLFLKFGATASSTSFTVKLAPGGYFEAPVPVIYTGIIDGIWDIASGSARVTEVSP